jgi:signal transduction histidine kinase/PAS domain-containing protein
MAEENDVRVLFVAPDQAPLPSGEGHGNPAMELIREPSLAHARRRLELEPVDVVVVAASVAGAGDGELKRLQSSTDGTPVLVTDDLAAAAGLAAELARTRRDLARSEARFRDVIERNADAIVVVDQEGVVRFANGVAAELFGRARSDLVGSPFGYPMTVGESTEVDVVRNGDPPRAVELRVVESEWEGEAACIISLRDITERRRAEEDMRRLIRARAARSAAELSARRFRFLAEATAVLSSSLDYERTLAALARLCVSEIADWALVYIVDDDGEVHRLEVAHRDPSKVELVGELRDLPIEPGGSHPVLGVLESGRPLLVRDVDTDRLAEIAQAPRHLELLLELGARSFMLVPLIARGRSLGALGLVCTRADSQFDGQDLTLAENLASRAALAVDNARLYGEAQEATRTKTDLLTVISHDLRTPLNSIIGYAELLIMGVPEPLSESTRERVERMRAGAQHLLHLINQLLALSRLDAGREEVRAEELDVADLVREVAVVVEPLALERSLGFVLDLPDRRLTLRTDEGKLRQVLVNLAANAIKFTERGEVRVRVEASASGGANIHVADTGPGIAEEHRERIFEPFWQVDAAQRGNQGGTGLGLSVVSRLVELLGGRISVESRLGEGSTFTVALPAAIGEDT